MVQSALPVPALLSSRAATAPDHEALIVAGRGGLTLGEWDERSDAAAHHLLDRGVRRGDRVALVFGGGDWLDYAVSWMAVLKAGAVAVPLSDRLAAPELAALIEHCGATTTIRRGDELTGASGRLPFEADPLDLAQILYTSGTTGQPKGVAASHANLTSPPVHPKRRPFAHSRHLVHAFPIGTNAGQVMLLHALTAAPTVVTPPLFTPARFAALIEAYAAGTVFVVPAMAVELLGARVQDRHDLSSVLLLGSAAAALPPKVAAELTEAFPNATVANYYTSTEAAPAQTIMIYDPDRPGALGHAAGALRIADADGNPAGPGETGEVWLRGPAHSRAYYGEQRDDTFRDGWVRMGDLGYLDEEGYLYLVDRESDVIKSGAVKVSTLQVEAALHEHPAVSEAAVFGVPHPVMGMAVAAAVVSHEPVTLAGLRAFLSERLAQHELPTRLLCVDSLPRNTAGKVIKRELRGMAEE
ncbi:AMP-binding protein [Nonomuraea sp. 3-1Str]|uniref:class I adenylate-forming enzyme family protein n=1 Tax=Nonomuraea sp. 3-1Str TaxID=2929801 RepID=UPI00285AEE64|nr:AMP-binding protein [Nonomuraea sp. 3-1Str]MDR8412887.1 AMP-binding protein [Nonomuraea sp. 3-1Str]